MQDIATKTEGSQLTPAEFNQIPEELENAITSVGQTLTSSDTTQLSKAIAAYAAAGTSYDVSGTANNLVLSLHNDFRNPIKYYQNHIINFIPTANNTGPVTLNISGLPTVNLLTSLGQNLQANELVANTPYTAMYNGSNFLLVDLTANYLTTNTAQTITSVKTFDVSPLVPTPALSDNSTKPATTAFFANKLQVVEHKPSTVDEDAFYFVWGDD